MDSVGYTNTSIQSCKPRSGLVDLSEWPRLSSPAYRGMDNLKHVDRMIIEGLNRTCLGCAVVGRIYHQVILGKAPLSPSLR